MPEKYEELNKEIEMISDSKIRDFVKTVLNAAPDYFWTVASSTSGKYHPEFALGEKGLIRHTRAVVKIVKELIVAYELEEFKDHIIAAAILHDVIKNGELYKNGVFDPSEPNITSTHGVRAVKFFEKISKTEGTDLQNIGRLVSKHMGRWSPEGFKPDSKGEWCVHIADFIASRRFIDIKWDK